MKIYRFAIHTFLLVCISAPMSAGAEKSIEERATQVFDDILVQQGAPVLQLLIARSRDEALRAGVLPIPAEIRQRLVGFIPDVVLDAARYRVQGGDDLTLQVNAIRYGDTAAITLDYVIVFKKPEDVLHNLTLWAHELTHVGQYQRWGIRDFSIRYLRNFQAVEQEAYAAEEKYAAWAGA